MRDAAAEARWLVFKAAMDRRGTGGRVGSSIDDAFRSCQMDCFDRGQFDERQIDQKFHEVIVRMCDGASTALIDRLISRRGQRYTSCEFGTFTADSQDRINAIERLQQYVSDLERHCREGNGVILFGPRGTGKDHLAVSLAKECARRACVEVEWRNGMDIFAEFRDSFHDGAKVSEQSIVAAMTKPDVLYISDPLPPSGALSEFQMGALFRILDSRYSHCKPTWVTINVRDGAEMDQRLGAQNGDRLRDGALAVFCNWASHRKAIQ